MQQKSSDEDGKHAGPDEPFDDVGILGLELLEPGERLALLEEELYLPAQAVERGDGARREPMCAERREQIDVFVLPLDVEENEAKLVSFTFDQKVNITLGQFEVFQLLAGDILVPEGTSKALEDLRIEALVAHASQVIAASLFDLRGVFVAASSADGVRWRSSVHKTPSRVEAWRAQP